jgi:hypothetical protein
LRKTDASMLLWLILLFLFPSPPPQDYPQDGFQFDFKSDTFLLQSRIRNGSGNFFPRNRLSNRQLDTMCNWYSPLRRQVSIIRQDDPLQPRYGLALSFEFTEEFEEFPFTPAEAVVQFKDFSWGGIEFSAADTCNYTGVSNAVSDDVTVLVEGFSNDTIYGRFNAVLLSGAGPMAFLENGRFRVRVYRVL